MTHRAARLSGSLPLAHLVGSNLYLARMVAAGLLAIGLSGVLCSVLGFRLGDHTIAAADDSRSATSAERCADLREYYPDKPTCVAAEIAHHADEVVAVRVGAGILGLIALACWTFIAR